MFEHLPLASERDFAAILRPSSHFKRNHDCPQCHLGFARLLCMDQLVTIESQGQGENLTRIELIRRGRSVVWDEWGAGLRATLSSELRWISDCALPACSWRSCRHAQKPTEMMGKGNFTVCLIFGSRTSVGGREKARRVMLVKCVEASRKIARNRQSREPFMQLSSIGNCGERDKKVWGQRGCSAVWSGVG